MSTPIDILFPVGRIVAGSVSKPNDTDNNGKPRVYTSGPNIGKPRTTYDFAVAIEKTAGHTHWAQTEWGAKIYAVGAAAHPNAYQSPGFAWKVKDGDSTIPNRKGNKPCDQDGFPGHWVLWFSSGYPVRTLRDNGTAPMPAEEVKTGHYVQVFGSCAGNSGETPGVYLNHNLVNWAYWGKEIASGPDPRAVGFGVGVQMPAGASLSPPAGSFAPPVPGTPAMGVPGAPALPPGVPALPVAPPAAVMVAPHPGFLPSAGPAAPAMAPPVPVPQPMPLPPVPPAPVAPAAPAGPALTPKGLASGFTYEQYRASNWSDDALRAAGLIA
jgi:hypothetical protein